MIKEIKVYTIICDKCGANSSDDGEYCGWNEESYVLDCAIEDDWVEYNNEHYCPNCYTRDDDDNLIIK